MTDASARPTPDGSARSGAQRNGRPRWITSTGRRARGGEVTQVGFAPSNVMTAAGTAVMTTAGTAVVTAARVGVLLGRTGWQLARQLPGAQVVERSAQRLQTAALTEARRRLQIPQMGNRRVVSGGQRAVDLIRIVEPGGTDPLRTAMSDLLERSVAPSQSDTREYLYATIIGQLVPDEARILAVLADGTRYAAMDVVQRQRRGDTRLLLAHASAVGREAGLVAPDDTPTYLARLHAFGLVEFGPPDESLTMHYDALATDPQIRALTEIDARRGTTIAAERKTVQISAFGKQFWSAADPSGITS